VVAGSSESAEKAKAESILNAAGGQTALQSVYDAIGGEKGVEDLYKQLGGQQAVMNMVAEGKGLPAGFQLPPALLAFKAQLQNAASAQSGTNADYDYEEYYVDANGRPITPVSGPTPVVRPPAPAPVDSKSTVASKPQPAAPAPSKPAALPPPNPSLESSSGSLFDFLDQADPTVSSSPAAAPSQSSPSSSTPDSSSSQTSDPAPKKKKEKSLQTKLQAAQQNSFGRR
jgi:hypothetical protein